MAINSDMMTNLGTYCVLRMTIPKDGRGRGKEKCMSSGCRLDVEVSLLLRHHLKRQNWRSRAMMGCHYCVREMRQQGWELVPIMHK